MLENKLKYTRRRECVFSVPVRYNSNLLPLTNLRQLISVYPQAVPEICRRAGKWHVPLAIEAPPPPSESAEFASRQTAIFEAGLSNRARTERLRNFWQIQILLTLFAVPRGGVNPGRVHSTNLDMENPRNV